MLVFLFPFIYLWIGNIIRYRERKARGAVLTDTATWYKLLITMVLISMVFHFKMVAEVYSTCKPNF